MNESTDNKVYKVVNGCNVATKTDSLGKRYEIGDAYNSADHPAKDTKCLLEMGCIEEAE